MEINKKNMLSILWKEKANKIREKVKENKIQELEALRILIEKKSLVIALASLLKVEKLEQQIDVKSISEDDKMLILNALENKIKEKAELMKNKNIIIFKLELCKPNLMEKTLLEIIVWIYNVNIKQEKLKKDNKKQFYYLIYNYQQAKMIKEKEEILLELLYKMQLYIKNAR
jgi:hypothetical protein